MRAPLKAYVAGRTSDIENVRHVQQILKDNDWEITFDWTGEEGEIRSDWSEKPERARELSTRELNAVLDADMVVGVYHNGRGLGKIIEIGMGLGAGKTVVLIGPFRESVFWYLPNVVRVEDRAHFLRMIEELEG